MNANGTDKARVVIMASGRGSNAAALRDAMAAPDFPAECAAVVCDRVGAGVLGRDFGGADVVSLNVRGMPKEEAESHVFRRVLDYAPDIVCLAGYMRILSADSLRQFQGHCILNIHPAVDARLDGQLETHAKALAMGLPQHGAKVHRVVEAVDAGEIVMQAVTNVTEYDTAETLGRRVLELEHEIYPAALRRIALACLGREN